MYYLRYIKHMIELKLNKIDRDVYICGTCAKGFGRRHDLFRAHLTEYGHKGQLNFKHK